MLKGKQILAMKGINKRFGDMMALTDVDFQLFAGEVHALVGENGAGKSTLIKILSGAERATSGEIELFGEDYVTLTPDLALSLGVATIYQDVELISSLTVADNIFLGHEKTRVASIVDFDSQKRATRKLLDSLNINIDEGTIVENLSPAQQQMLQIVKALHHEAKILIMDEPTVSLGQEETQALLNLVKQLTARGIGIIYISHFLEEVFQISDRVTVLKDGLRVGTYNTGEIDEHGLANKMIGRERSNFFERERVVPGEIILEVKNLSSPPLVNNANFSLHRGEILGFGGLVGAGRSELMRVLYGIEPSTSGEIVLHGKRVVITSPRAAIEAGLGIIPEDRKNEALLMSRSLLENVALVENENGNMVLNLVGERSLAKKMIERLAIATSGFLKPVGQLSGGNQQKVVIARWLESNADIFIFDEPTKGVDIGAKKHIYDLMVELAKAGKGVLMVSSDMTELMSMSDRIVIMRSNSIVDIVDAKTVSEQSLVAAFLGLDFQGGEPDDGILNE